MKNAKQMPSHTLFTHMTHKFSVLHWPSQSSDQNPVAHLWDVLEQETESMKVRLKIPQELHDAIMSTRGRNSKAFFFFSQQLMESMSWRIDEFNCFESKGGPTHKSVIKCTVSADLFHSCDAD